MNHRHATSGTRRSGLPLLLVSAFVVALAAMVAPTPLSAPDAVAEPGEYVRQNSATYVPVNGEAGGKPSDDCVGKVVIGQTTTNSIQAYSELTCGNPYAISGTETWIAPPNNGLERLAEHKSVCNTGDCRYVTAAVSMPGGPSGTTYCGHAFGTNSWPGRVFHGGTSTCITTA